MDVVKFTVNGAECEVGRDDVYSDTMLLEYIRKYLQLPGTKYLCREGGCGACLVTAVKTPGGPQQAINSCLTAVASCHGWNIKTIEGLGNRKDGYHQLQTSISESHASQCGHCAPGWLMGFHGLLESKKNLTMLEIEKSVSSNLCRCSGYRSILTALKQFASDCPAEDRITNIKDLSICKAAGNCCQSSNNEKEDGWCMVGDDICEEKMKKVTFKDGKTWYRPSNLAEALNLLKEHSVHSENYMLIAGNTSKGVYPREVYPDIMIAVGHLKELKVEEVDQNFIVGAGFTLTEFMDKLKAGAALQDFSYLQKLHDHMELVAHIPVRNLGTIAGNLMTKHAHNVFQSDVFLILDTVGAQLCITNCYGVEETVTMSEFLKISMKAKVILKVMFRPLTEAYHLFTSKLMPRAQSAHAIVNFGFLCKLNSANEVEECRIKVGGLSENFHEAPATERCLLGKPLFTNDTLQAALRVLDAEMVVEDHPPEPSIDYRRFVTKALLFKALLYLSPQRPARCDSAIVDLHKSRPCSSGKQTYTSDTSKWPLNEPVGKLEALIQCSGEARYTEDLPPDLNEVYAAFVLSSVAQGTILKMDPSPALAIPGVIAYYTHKDIPGLNSFTPTDSGVTTVDEEILCKGTVKHHSQPIGIIVAETQNIAYRASKLVKVTYCNVTKPVTDINVAKKDSTRNTQFISVDATNPGTDTVYKTITGSNILYGQYHFPMETIVCVAKRTEDGIDIRYGSQWADLAQIAVSRVLNINQNKVNVYSCKVGGSFGQKITRSNQCAAACSLVAYKENRPCRFIQPLVTNMRACGKRTPCVNDYEVAVNKSGVIQYLNITNYTDNGHLINEPVIAYGVDVYNNVYDVTKINYTAYNTCTDTPKTTFCRSPGTLDTNASTETVLERISYELCMDPLTVRKNNLDLIKYPEIAEIIKTMETSVDWIASRAAVDSFNAQNRYKKQGLACSLCRWPPVGGFKADVNISVYLDGTVSVTHGGVEMGQGLNTKVAQITAHLLNVPLDKIAIKESNTICAPNTFATGASITTEAIIIALKRCAAELLARLEYLKASLTNPTWSELITAAFKANIDLQAHGYVSSSDAQSYEIYGMACCKAEIDVLTGESEILDVKIVQDVGFSINPLIDIGQIEGAFVMGLGYWTCEKMFCDPDTGELLTDSSWNYHLPQARDIPLNFDVTCRNYESNELILGSKGVGEPATCLAVVVPFALRAAIVAARQECGIPKTEWFEIAGPFSTENICMATRTNTDDFKLT